MMNSMSLNQKFVLMAHPHQWMMVSDDLFSQAQTLRVRRNPGISKYIDHMNGASHEWRIDDRSVFLLSGFAIENAIKAFLVYENPNWISNGKLAKPLKSHALVRLRNMSSIIPFRNKYTWILEYFETGIESWARYPCGLDATQTEQMRKLSDQLWKAYVRIMRAYGRKMEILLKKGWNGPHGQSGYIDFQGSSYFRL